MEKLKENKKLIIPLILVALVFILGAAYAWLTQVLNGTQINRIKAGVLELTLDDRTSDGIDLEYAVPQSDSQGLNNTAYTFTVKNTGGMNAEYKLYLEDEEIEGTRISDSNIKYNLVKNNGEDNPKILSSRELESTIINGGSTNEYSLKLWIDSEATQSEVANKVFKAKIKLEAVQSENSSDDEYELNGVITRDGTPVTDGTVVIYPTGQTSPVGNEGSFNIPSLDYGNYDIYYIPNVSEETAKNMTENDIKNNQDTIHSRIIVSVDPITINPAQGYTITINPTKKPKIKKGIYKYTNDHIKGLYVYNEDGTGTGTSFTGCLGGDEAGCVDEKQKVDSNPSDLPVGTIVKYEVLPGKELYFNVLYDKGDTLIMQERENILEGETWYGTDSSDYTSVNGPALEYGYALYDLEISTSEWQYVNNQTYTLGETVFGTGDFATANTGCTDSSGNPPKATICTAKPYPNITRTNVKARMITAQEAGEMGCKFSTSQSCKKFMTNYLKKSVSNGNTFTEKDNGYWTSTAHRSLTGKCFAIIDTGKVGINNTYHLNNGARPVVVVNK